MLDEQNSDILVLLTAKELLPFAIRPIEFFCLGLQRELLRSPSDALRYDDHVVLAIYIDLRDEA